MGLLACSHRLEDYAASQPRLLLEDFFVGPLEAHGMVQNRWGKVLRRFQVTMVGRMEEETLILEEDFVYDDGEQQRRVWRIEVLGNGHYRGRAGDVVGAAEGQVQGFALNWHYTLQVPVNDRNWDIRVNDWMFMLDERRILNRATMSKFGVTVGEITLWIERP